MKTLLRTILVFLPVVVLCEARALPVIGLGMGINTYPRVLDPAHTLNRMPVLSTHLAMSMPIYGRFSVVTLLARSVMRGTLAHVPDEQSFELYTAGCGFDFNLGSYERPLALGCMVMTGFGIYDAGHTVHTNTGSGLKIYMSAHQPVSRQYSYELRSGLLRFELHGLPYEERLQDNSFFVELTGYFGR